MRIAKSRYDIAKKEIAENDQKMAKYRETVKTWEAAIKHADNAENVIAIDVEENGDISFTTKPKKNTDGQTSPANKQETQRKTA